MHLFVFEIWVEIQVEGESYREGRSGNEGMGEGSEGVEIFRVCYLYTSTVLATRFDF